MPRDRPVVFIATILTCVVRPSLLGESKGDLRFKVLPGRMSQGKAQSECRSQGTGWDLPDSQNFKTELLQELRANNFYTTWLSLQRISFSSWEWTDGSIYNATLDPFPSYKCAGLAIHGMRIRPIRCSERGNGFVCQIQECKEQHLTQACFKYGESSYIMGCSSTNWYDARAFCFRRGGDLAVVKTRDVQLALLNHIIEKKMYDFCNWLYIGLAMEDWRNSEQGNLTSVFWDTDQPRPEDCAIAKVDYSNGKLVWESRPCEEDHSVVCQNYSLPASYPATGPCTSYKRTSSSYGQVYFLYGFLSASILAVILGPFCLVLMKKTDWSRKSSKDNQLPPHIKAVEDARTLVIVSPEKQRLATKRHFVVEEITCSSKSEESNNLSCVFKTAKYAINTFHLTNSNGKLRVICIYAPSLEGTISEITAIKIINYLMGSIKKNGKLVIDAVCFPRFHRDAENPAMLTELLWELRSHTVVISAPHIYPSLPSTEVLSVGVFKDMDKKASSSYDIRVKLPKDVSRSGQPGAIILAGLISGLKEKKAQPFYTKDVWEACVQLRRGYIDLSHIDLENGVLSASVATSTETDEPINAETKELENLLKSQCPSKKHGALAGPQSETITFKQEFLKEYRITVAFVHRRNRLQCDGWNISNPPRYGAVHEVECQENENAIEKKSERIIDFFFKMFDKCKIDREILHDVIQVYDIPTFSENFDLHVQNYGSILDKARQDKCDILFTHCLKNSDLEGNVIKFVESMEELKQKSIVICPAIAALRPPVPPMFPGDMVITVGCEGRELTTGAKYQVEQVEFLAEPDRTDISDEKVIMLEKSTILNTAKSFPDYQLCGSTLDFVCNKDTGFSEQGATDPINAALTAVAIAAIILIKAKCLGFDDDTLNRLRETSTMHRIFRSMCIHSGRHNSSYEKSHEIYDGWGCLHPWAILSNPVQLYELIRECVPKERQFYSWNGKNI